MRVYDATEIRHRNCKWGCCSLGGAIRPSRHAGRVRGKRDKSRRPAKRRARREARNEIFNAMQEGA